MGDAFSSIATRPLSSSSIRLLARLLFLVAGVCQLLLNVHSSTVFFKVKVS